jgi:hypothetical protein
MTKATVTELHRRPAKRPEARIVSVSIETGPFEGWAATARADFAAGLLADLTSGDIGRIMTVLDRIIVDHNFPNANDELAKTMAEVDPYAGLLEVGGAIFDAIGKLPNR